MIFIFDLDDTIFKEFDYVKSGFKFCAKFLSKNKISTKKIYNNFIRLFRKNGRGKVFDLYFKGNKSKSKKLISLYRKHYPDIKAYKDALNLIRTLKKKKIRMYIVTDGIKDSQYQKIKKLNIKKYFKKIFITPVYGKTYMKPSIKCFEIIKKIEKCNWHEMVYIGDNPKKDFVNLNKKKVTTIRILRGEFKKLDVLRLRDAKYKIKNHMKILKIFNI